ncbi:ROK family protein [Rarobacter incanus]|uniref:Putative NBD/HSP70 family sugar kinase n=1 Tax=Rarobacter incanus TaxID=153494 RepID=A0A542SRN8_9MICO|nr:ROK family protein [Rarobacter incanus]TQK77248.1 putative NBD/HSP70 family sugar kinase [Rarobacter incanus]
MNKIGLDIGGTKTLGVVIGDDGSIVTSAQSPTRFGEDGVLETASALVETLLAAADISPSSLSSIGIGIPGHVDRAGGIVRNAVNIGVQRLDIARRLRARFGIEIGVDNDVTAAAIGTAHLMRLQGTIALLNLGTGLAAGIVRDGKPWRGSTGVAGEIGHFPVDPLGLDCPCGQRGCLETIASGSALRRAWPRGGDRPGRVLLSAIATGDAEAQRAFDQLAAGTAAAVRLLVLSLDPETIVIGGGLSRLGEPLRQAVRAQLGLSGAESQFLTGLHLAERVRLLPTDMPAAAVGAALVQIAD